jgi:branched-chain amino acid aminotransferase
MAVCWVNGSINTSTKQVVSLLDHGFLYGDGVFEGVRFYNHKPFHLQAHLDRLENSAQVLQLKSMYSRIQLEQAIDDAIAAFAESDGYLRIIVTRGEGRLGVDPSSCKQSNTFIIADQLQVVGSEVREKGARIITASTRRLPSDGLDPRVKSLNYLNQVLARLEANNAGADEAVMLNHQGKVTEGTTDNLFVVHAGVLMTPPTSDGALQGVTRDLVLRIAEEQNIPVRLCSLTTYDLYTADECLLTGTAMELVPVREVDGRFLKRCPGPVFALLNNRFKQITASASAKDGAALRRESTQ